MLRNKLAFAERNSISNQIFYFFGTMRQQKRYVVWQGIKIGVFGSWVEVQPLVSGVKGAKFKSFSTLQVAEDAFRQGREPYYQPEKKWYEKSFPFVRMSIAVDAACSSATGNMEYQGIDLFSGARIFHASYARGTNNIGEFLAIVHGLSWIHREKKADYALYSDSKIALRWVKEKCCKTNVSPNKDNDQLFAVIRRAEERLQTHQYTTPLLKRDTEAWGEIPADFGRK